MNRTKPPLVGEVILDLAKKYMFEFHYTKMKPNLELELLYSDTDSFLYALKTEDIYENFKFFQTDFDFFNYPSDHPLYSEGKKTFENERRDGRKNGGGICSPEAKTLLHTGQG